MIVTGSCSTASTTTRGWCCHCQAVDAECGGGFLFFVLFRCHPDHDIVFRVRSQVADRHVDSKGCSQQHGGCVHFSSTTTTIRTTPRNVQLNVKPIGGRSGGHLGACRPRHVGTGSHLVPKQGRVVVVGWCCRGGCYCGCCFSCFGPQQGRDGHGTGKGPSKGCRRLHQQDHGNGLVAFQFKGELRIGPGSVSPCDHGTDSITFISIIVRSITFAVTLLWTTTGGM